MRPRQAPQSILLAPSLTRLSTGVRSYNFLVKYPWLWRLNFMASSPAPVHNSMFLAYSAMVARSFAAAFDKYDPDLIISVHPLMQHVPVRCIMAHTSSGV